MAVLGECSLNGFIFSGRLSLCMFMQAVNLAARNVSYRS